MELSDTSTKSDDKSQKPDSDKSEEGLVASSRALLKEKAKSSSGSRAKSNQCSVEIGVVEDGPKPEKANDSETKDSDKQTDEGQSRSRRQTRSQKPKCEVSIVID